jgi:hypothetical protein
LNWNSQHFTETAFFFSPCIGHLLPKSIEDLISLSQQNVLSGSTQQGIEKWTVNGGNRVENLILLNVYHSDENVGLVSSHYYFSYSFLVTFDWCMMQSCRLLMMPQAVISYEFIIIIIKIHSYYNRIHKVSLEI